MDVGLDLRDLRQSGRLAAFSKSLKCSEFEGLGILANFYFATQDAEIVRGSVGEISHAARVLLFGVEVVDVLCALVHAGLADQHEDGSFFIRGNDKHVDKLRKWRAAASLGGAAKAAKWQANGKRTANTEASERQPIGKRTRALVTGIWDLDTGSTASPGEHEQKRDRDLLVPLTEAAHAEAEARASLPLPPAAQETGKTNSRKSAKGGRSDAQQEAARVVRETFKASYARRYMLPLTAWGAPENSHLYHLLKTWPVAELVVMARRYFEWAHKGAIDAGHPFMNHRASFSALVHELKADIVAPERRAQSAAVEQQRKEHDVRAANADAMDRATKLLQEQGNGIMGRPTGTEPALRDTQGGDRALGGRTREEDERGGAGTLAEALAAARRLGPVPGT